MKMDKNVIFQECKKNHPNWSNEKVWTFVSLTFACDDVIGSSSSDVSFSENLLESVLDKAKKWLLENVPMAHENVADIFAELKNNSSEWTKHYFKK